MNKKTFRISVIILLLVSILFPPVKIWEQFSGYRFLFGHNYYYSIDIIRLFLSFLLSIVISFLLAISSANLQKVISFLLAKSSANLQKVNLTFVRKLALYILLILVVTVIVFVISYASINYYYGYSWEEQGSNYFKNSEYILSIDAFKRSINYQKAIFYLRPKTQEKLSLSYMMLFDYCLRQYDQKLTEYRRMNIGYYAKPSQDSLVNLLNIILSNDSTQSREAYSKIASYLYSFHRCDLASGVYSRMEKQWKLNDEEYLWYSASCLNCRDEENAIIFGHKAIEINPRSNVAYEVLGIAYMNGCYGGDRLTELQAAIDSFNKALSLNPQFYFLDSNEYLGDSYYQLGVEYYVRNNKAKELEYYRKAAKCGSKEAITWFDKYNIKY